MFKGYSLTKGAYSFGFKLEGALVKYKMVSKIKGKNTNLSKETPVDLSVPDGYSLRGNVIDMADASISLHCDAITSKTDLFGTNSK